MNEAIIAGVFALIGALIGTQFTIRHQQSIYAKDYWRDKLTELMELQTQVVITAIELSKIESDIKEDQFEDFHRKLMILSSTFFSTVVAIGNDHVNKVIDEQLMAKKTSDPRILGEQYERLNKACLAAGKYIAKHINIELPNQPPLHKRLLKRVQWRRSSTPEPTNQD